MLARLKSGLKFSNVISVIALFVALVGGAYAADLIGPDDIARNAVRSRHVQNNSIRGADVLERTLGRVRRATRADTATTATSATSADSAASATNATNAALAANAELLDSIDSNGFIQGSGRVRVFHGAEPESGADPDPIPISTGGELTLTCPNFASAGAQIRYRNTSVDAVDAWTETRRTGTALSADNLADHDASYLSLAMNQSTELALSAISGYVGFAEFVIRRGAEVARIEARMKRDGLDSLCHYVIFVTEMTGGPIPGGG
jgi:hypothetical protein